MLRALNVSPTRKRHIRRRRGGATLSVAPKACHNCHAENSAAGAPMPESVKVFLSTVSDEFRLYRDLLRSDLTRYNVEVKVQEDFKDLGRGILDELDVYIAHCDCVVHLVGDMTGSAPLRAVDALLAKYPDLIADLPPLGEALRDGVKVSYTQWEAWLALYHRKLLV